VSCPICDFIHVWLRPQAKFVESIQRYLCEKAQQQEEEAITRKLLEFVNAVEVEDLTTCFLKLLNLAIGVAFLLIASRLHSPRRLEVGLNESEHMAG